MITREEDELTEIGLKYKTDKADPHYFTAFYDRHFKSLREQVTNVLEIGVYEGGSLRMWQDYFANASIFGIDVREDYLFDDERIKTFLVGQEDYGKIHETFTDVKFDIIVDDGNHLPHAQVDTFLNIKDMVKSGGFYVVEDLHTSYLPEFVSQGVNADQFFRNLGLEEHSVDFVDFYSNLDRTHGVECITGLIKFK